jgi:uncharacterized membrane protein YkoI
MRPRALRLVFFICAAAAAMGLAWADDNDERERLRIMRGAVERGQAKPLTEVLEIARKAHPGEVVGVEFEMKGGNWVYEVKIADKTGHLVEVYVNAVDGNVLSIKEK